MDALEYQQSRGYLNNTGEAKTGLEPTAESQVNTSKQDTSAWQNVSSLLSKGLDLGLAVVDPNRNTASRKEEEQPNEEIFGMPKMLVYGGIAAVGLIAVVYFIRRSKK